MPSANVTQITAAMREEGLSEDAIARVLPVPTFSDYLDSLEPGDGLTPSPYVPAWADALTRETDVPAREMPGR